MKFIAAFSALVLALAQVASSAPTSSPSVASTTTWMQSRHVRPASTVAHNTTHTAMKMAQSGGNSQWEGTTVTWYDGSMLDDPECYNGEYQPDDSSLVAAVVMSDGYASCKDMIEIARFDDSGNTLASVVVQVVDACSEGCDDGKDGHWFDLTKGAFDRLFDEDVGQADVWFRHISSSSISEDDRDLYPSV
ncbi:hypothetical protein BOTBODRAFT_188533 [Botryobasidium botryosum FD-172 SS1]|uniref:RlpA-like protein double-psi beta-barrel domain-containing protein n=1 Tax=Botryobasidium botryosum (strain FD-172 SS1) TaxID=930990 RepID=A0A067MFS4_BOTB1|nr:hypothetical protein BOTBODRAFT_188533 [Botryobasidium botryosum FD-172 SS1]